VVEGVVADVVAWAPDVTVVSGDLSQRARTREFTAARAFLDRLPGPLVVVPGNHDVPLYDLLRRALRPRSRYHRIVTAERTPFVEAAGAAVLGLDTTRPERWKNGDLEDDDLAAITRHLAPLPTGVLKVVVTHHPFVAPPSNPDASIVVGAERALAVAADAGVDLLLSGHRHTAHRAGIAGAVRGGAGQRGMLVVMAGTATSRRRRGEPNGWTTIDGDADGLTLGEREWDGTAFAHAREDRYVHAPGGWVPA
jgi:3',5'-cyclic AMP phosphodiesterase CpdA